MIVILNKVTLTENIKQKELINSKKGKNKLFKVEPGVN
jgi:hypothetical protein